MLNDDEMKFKSSSTLMTCLAASNPLKQAGVDSTLQMTNEF